MAVANNNDVLDGRRIEGPHVWGGLSSPPNLGDEIADWNPTSRATVPLSTVSQSSGETARKIWQLIYAAYLQELQWAGQADPSILI